MNAAVRWIRRAILPAAVFAAVIALHIVYRGVFPEHDPAQDRWATPLAADGPSWVESYIQTGSYWNGISYAIPLAFAASMFRRYRARRRSADAKLAVGGLTISGVMSVVGCFLAGCCGSPMLGVYLGFFGAAFLPFAKPLSAILSAVSVTLAWLWMRRRERRLMAAGGACPPSAACACGPGCDGTVAPSADVTSPTV